MVSTLGATLSAAQRNQLTAIQSTSRLIDSVQLRLASGRDVNTAIDNPQNFFSSRALEFRAHDLERRLDGIRQGIRTLEETQNGIDASLKIIDLLESYLINIEEQFLSGDIDLFAQGAPTNVTEIKPGAADFISYAGGQDSGGPVTVTNGGSDFTLSGNLWKKLALNYTVTADTVLEFEFASALTAEISAIGFETDDTFNNDNDRFFLNGTQFGGLNYSVPIGTYQYTGGGAYESYSIPIGTFFTGAYTHITFINDDDAAPLGDSSYRNVILREGPIDNALVASSDLEQGYVKILEQLDGVVVDADYRGINLLNNETLETIFNEDATNSLVTDGIDSTSFGLGLVREGFDTVEAVQQKIDQVKDARNDLRTYNTTIASDLTIIQTRETFTREVIATLLSGSDDLVVADQNELGAKYLALQVRQDIQFTTLALSAEAESLITQLF